MPLTSAGGDDGFVAKYALDGSVAWARRFGGSGVDGVSSVAVDPAGQFLYVTGGFKSSADLTGDGVPDVTPQGQTDAFSDVFLVKLDAVTGQTVWFRTLGSAYQDVANDVVTDGAAVYVTGSFRGPADFDPGSNTVTLTPAGSGNNRPADAFVWKLDAAGNYAAAWRLGSTYDNYGLVNDAGNSLALDGSSLYLQGSFGGTVDFDPSAVVQSKTSVGGVDAFIARYTTSGQLTWVQSIGSVNYDDSDFRMTADSGSLYLTGPFAGAIDFDPGIGITTLDNSSAYDDVATAKYSKADGSLAWARQFGGAGNDYGGVECVIDPMTGAVYFGMNSTTPSTNANIDLNPGNPGGEFAIVSSDGFLVKLDANGNYLNAWQVGGLGYDGSPRPMGLIDGTLYVAGTFEQTVTFPTGGTLTSIGGRDMYLMAFDPQLHAAIVTPTSGLITTEAGGQATFTVRLDSPPTADVTIPVSSSNTTEGTVPTSSLTFNTANWNVPQTVTITGVDDVATDGNVAYTIVLGAATSTDPLYNGVNPSDVSVSNTDNDTPQTKFYVVNDGSPDRTYEYSSTGTAVENYAISTGNTAPRGAASTAAGNKVWVVDANHNVYVYNTGGTLLGSWTASNFNNSAQLEGIATNGTDVWIVDAKSNKVYKYTGAAGITAGSQSSASSFALNSGNASPKDIVTDGVNLWVVNDSTTDKVFKYTVAGALVGSWTIGTSGASSPTGLTIDPSNVNNVWIVDSGTDRVYQYDAAAGMSSGTLSASTSFALSAGNTNPQGIADPPPPVAESTATTGVSANDLALLSFISDMDDTSSLTQKKRLK